MKNSTTTFMRHLNRKPKFGKGGFWEYGTLFTTKNGRTTQKDCWVCVGHQKKK